jgi:hypothetical protein
MTTTNLTPEMRAEMVAFIREGAMVNRERSNSQTGWFTAADKQRFALKADALTAAADALEALPGLAEQARVMREALREIAKPGAEDDHQDADIPFVCWLCGEPDGDCLAECPRTVANTALALTATEAEAQAKANAEKAHQYDETRKVMSGLWEDKPLQDAVAMRIVELVNGFAPEHEEWRRKAQEHDEIRAMLEHSKYRDLPLHVAVSHWVTDLVKQRDQALSERNNKHD